MNNQLYKKLVIIPLLALAASTISACDTASTPTAAPTTAPAASTSAPQSAATPTTAAAQGTTTSLQKVTIALGYLPDVQFAPFYLALNRGYYRDEGLDVTLQNGIVTDLIKQLGDGASGVNFAVVSGDELIPARLQGIPVDYVMTWYRKYPVAAVSIDGKGPSLKSPVDLKGKRVGVPGPFGSTYTGLLALLKAGNLTLSDIQMESINFTQVASLATGKVDVAMVYAANEPTQLKSQGFNVTTLNVADIDNLASNGLATNDQTLKQNPDLVAKVVKATLKGIQETINDPNAAFQSTLKQVPEAGGKNAALQSEILTETVKLMQTTNPISAGPGAGAANIPLGFTDPAVWDNTQNFLYDAKIITSKADITQMFTNKFVNAPNQ
jgi:NitT/TauT family transport system substrate-binding protein